jgi:hypothetical protein
MSLAALVVLALPLRLLHRHRMRPMPTNLPPPLLPIVRELALYLIEQPQASDTPEGIGRWWLGEVAAPRVLQQALDWMKAQALLEEVIAADGRRRYRRCADDEALRALLAAAEPGR